MSAHERYAAAEARHIARFRSKFHMQRTEFESVARKQASASLNAKTLETASNIRYEVSTSAKRLMELRDQYKREMKRVHRSISKAASSAMVAPDTSSSSNTSTIILEAKTIIQRLPTFILDDDPELKSTLKIVRACSTFGFHPRREKSLGAVIDLIKRSAYAIDAPRAIQFLSSLQTFTPRPDDDIRAILDNVADGIRMGSNDLLVHEVTTLLSSILKLEQSEQYQQLQKERKGTQKKESSSSSSSSSSYQRKTLLDAITRHLVTYHSTAPINDVSKAAAFLTKISSPHGRVLLHEIQPRVAKEVNNLSIPPLAALDLLTGYGCVEPEDANPVVHFPRNYDLDADVAAPPSLFAPTRPIYRAQMLSMASETIMTHIDLLNNDDLAECFTALRYSAEDHLCNEVLVDRLISRAIELSDKTFVLSMLRILEGVNAFVVKPKLAKANKDKININKLTEEDPQLEGAMMLFDKYSKRIRSFNNNLSAASVANLLQVYYEGNQKAALHSGDENLQKAMLHLLDGLVKTRRNFKPINDALLIKMLDLIANLELYSDANGETPLKKVSIKVISMIVREIFVERGGLPAEAEKLIAVTESCVEKMLPAAENDRSLLEAIKPLVEG